MPDRPPPAVAILVKGYPRISETFIAKEILGLERRGLRCLIVSLRAPTDRVRHDLHEQIAAPILYLPEYLHDQPLRLLRALPGVLRRPGFGRALRLWWADLRRDRTRNRVRRFGQAIVMTAELPASVLRLHAHFIHTPGSVARYVAALSALPFSLSAHAKDIWTIPVWEKREKLAAAAWTVTCTALNAGHLRSLAPAADVELLYHGVDTERFRPHAQSSQRRCEPAAALTSVSVARCVPKKGLATLIHALAALPPGLAWRHIHVGGGPLLAELRALADQLGVADRITWRGTIPQLEVVQALSMADVLCLPSRIAEDGDRDGLPNVLLEAMAMGLPVVATGVSAIPELVIHERNGLLVPADDPASLALAIGRLAADAELCRRLGAEARATVLRDFSEAHGLDRLATRFGLPPPLADAA